MPIFYTLYIRNCDVFRMCEGGDGPSPPVRSSGKAQVGGLRDEVLHFVNECLNFDALRTKLVSY